MNYGLYLSASAMLAQTYRQDVFAHNLANVQTTGYKFDVPTVRQRDPESVEDRLGMDVSQRLLDRLGGGVLAGKQRMTFSVGAPQQTGNAFDIMLPQRDRFLSVAVQSAEGQPQARLTRDGRLSRDGEGYLVTVADGFKVLNQQDQPIRLDSDTPLVIDATGRVIQDGQVVDQLGIVRVDNLDRLVKRGQNLLGWDGPADPRQRDDQPQVRQGFIESSTVDPVKALMDLVSATKSVSGNANMIRYQDQLMDRAINTLGRVA